MEEAQNHHPQTPRNWVETKGAKESIWWIIIGFEARKQHDKTALSKCKIQAWKQQAKWSSSSSSLQ